MLLTVEVSLPEGNDGAWIDVEADSIEEARHLALQKWTGEEGAIAGRVFHDVTQATPEEITIDINPLDDDSHVEVIESDEVIDEEVPVETFSGDTTEEQP